METSNSSRHFVKKRHVKCSKCYSNMTSIQGFSITHLQVTLTVDSPLRCRGVEKGEYFSLSVRECALIREKVCVCVRAHLNASAATLPMSSADQANQQLPVCIGWARKPVGAPNKKLMHEPPHQQLRTISDSLQKHPDSECQVLSLMGERERGSKADKVRERENNCE